MTSNVEFFPSFVHFDVIPDQIFGKQFQELLTSETKMAEQIVGFQFVDGLFFTCTVESHTMCLIMEDELTFNHLYRPVNHKASFLG